MLGTNRNETVQIECKEQLIPEFPDVLFGTSPEGSEYFDATNYLLKQGSVKSVKDFFIEYNKPIESLCDSYDISLEKVAIINHNRHYLIDGNFVYLFIAFVEPHFLGYIFDRIHELFSKGVSVSDTYLLQAARERLSKEVLEEAIKINEQVK